ncbi:DUF6166 domain-containing protein [Chroococcidiopsis sp. CCMEE 29]|uniref:DUF6166 domain-containing protein n=1 Tax=Chroococcidiopsis sp. CCMEE 29 TaxID=155894 RepID=UPI00202109EB|nr:DUF6166 domain-containing protein [Chroococcidiopsis sp. CCMEE 29]
MKKFKDTTVRVAAEVYEQLQQMWEVGYSQGRLDYCNHLAPQAHTLARQLGLEQAAQWIRLHQNEYHDAQQNGHWGLDTSRFNGDVVMQRIGEIGTTALTNVPRACIHHSPDGHEWGYLGSGCADLALDILNWFLPPNKENGVVECFEGYSSSTAWNLHQEFKRDFISQVPHEGGSIKAEVIRQWIALKLTQHQSI